jgi:hypothetical protein
MVLMVYPFHLYNSGSRRDVIKLMELMVYPFHLHNSGSSIDVNKHHGWFTFSIYAMVVYFFHLRYTDQ